MGFYAFTITRKQGKGYTASGGSVRNWRRKYLNVFSMAHLIQGKAPKIQKILSVYLFLSVFGPVGIDFGFLEKKGPVNLLVFR